MPIIAPSADLAEPLGYVDPTDPSQHRRFSSIATPVIKTGQREVDMDHVASDDLAQAPTVELPEGKPGLMSPEDKAKMVPATATAPGYMTAVDKAKLDDFLLTDIDPETGQVVRADALRGPGGDVLLKDLELKINGDARGETNIVGPVWNTPGEVVYYVDVNVGDDTNGDGTEVRPFATLLRALEFHRSTYPGHVRTLVFNLGEGVYASPFSASVQSGLGISYDRLRILGQNNGTTKEGASRTILDGGTNRAIYQNMNDVGSLDITHIGLRSSGTAAVLAIQGVHLLYTAGYVGIISEGSTIGQGVLITAGATHFGGGHLTFIGNFTTAYLLDNGGQTVGFSTARIFSHYSGSLGRIIACQYGAKGFFNMGAARFIYGDDSTGDAAVLASHNSGLYVGAGPTASRTGTYSATADLGGFLYPANLFV